MLLLAEARRGAQQQPGPLLMIRMAVDVLQHLKIDRNLISPWYFDTLDIQLVGVAGRGACGGGQPDVLLAAASVMRARSVVDSQFLVPTCQV